MPLSKIKTNSIATGNITSALIASVANTAIVGRIASSQQTLGAVLQTTANTIFSPQSMSITTSGTMVASGFVLPITPSSATSKILILYTSTIGSTSSNSGVAGSVQMQRSINGGAYSYAGGSYNNYWNTIATYIAYQQLSFSILFLDSPGTTSQVIYQPYFNLSCGTAGGNGILGGRNTDGLSYSGSHMVAMEIAA